MLPEGKGLRQGYPSRQEQIGRGVCRVLHLGGMAAKRTPRGPKDESFAQMTLRQKISVEEIARACNGISYSSVRGYLQGLRMPPPHVVEELSRVTGFSVSEVAVGLFRDWFSRQLPGHSLKI